MSPWVVATSLAFLGVKARGVAPEVNLRILLMQVMKHAREGIHPDSETQDIHHQNSKAGVSMAPQKGLMTFKMLYYLNIVYCPKEMFYSRHTLFA